MAKVCFILRGLPGTGKSELAKHIMSGAYPTGFGAIFSTDDRFMVDGEYQFNPADLHVNHAENLRLATEWMKKHSQVISKAHCIIDNTNTQHWEYENYINAAKANGFRVQIISVDWKEEDIPLYAERNSHGVPEDAIRRMAERWEY